jgi:hypothetical protein
VAIQEFNSIPAFILQQSENISATNGCVVVPFCMSAWIFAISVSAKFPLKNMDEISHW